MQITILVQGCYIALTRDIVYTFICILLSVYISNITNYLSVTLTLVVAMNLVATMVMTVKIVTYLWLKQFPNT